MSIIPEFGRPTWAIDLVSKQASKHTNNPQQTHKTKNLSISMMEETMGVCGGKITIGKWF